MRRSIVRWAIALLVLTGVSAILSFVGAPSLPLAVAQPGAPAQIGDPNLLGRRSSEVLIDDVSRVTAPKVMPKPAKPVEVASIRLRRQPNPRIIKALAEPTSIEFLEAPLTDVIDFLKDLHAVEIQADTKALNDATIGIDIPVTCNLKGISLGHALDLMLNNLGLTYVVDGDVLLITHEGTVRAQLVVRLYDCAWMKPDRLRDLIDVIELVNSGRTIGSSVVADPGGDQPPGSADAFRVVPFGTWLVVRANEIEHESVRRLLAELRAAAEAEKAVPAAKSNAAEKVEGRR